MIRFPIRLDQYLVKKGFFISRNKAQQAIKSRMIFDRKGRVYMKPGFLIKKEIPLYLSKKYKNLVSRASFKIEKAANIFSFSFFNKIVVDVGASTGGFTNYAINKGAKLVYAVDVGYGQLISVLRNNPKVINMEKYNFRYANFKDFRYGKPEIGLVDVSFISLSLILPILYSILSVEGKVIALFKPQFEVGYENVKKNGIVKKPKAVFNSYKKISLIAKKLGFLILGFTDSPIKGAKGNQEFLIFLSKQKKKRVQNLSLSKVKKLIYKKYM